MLEMVDFSLMLGGPTVGRDQATPNHKLKVKQTSSRWHRLFDWVLFNASEDKGCPFILEKGGRLNKNF